MKFTCRSFATNYLIAILSLTSFCNGTEIVLDDVLVSKDSNINKSENANINGKFLLIRSIEKGKNLLGIKLTNTSDEKTQISNMLLGLDESYEFKIGDDYVPNNFNNHQVLDEIEELREKAGTRWLTIEAKASIVIVIDPTRWTNLRDYITDDPILNVEITSFLFNAKPAILKFKHKHN